MTIHPISTKSASAWVRENLSSLFKLLLVAGVILLSVLAPTVVSERQILLLIGGILGIGGVWLLLRWPALGILALIPTALLFPSPRLPGGFEHNYFAARFLDRSVDTGHDRE